MVISILILSTFRRWALNDRLARLGLTPAAEARPRLLWRVAGEASPAPPEARAAPAGAGLTVELRAS